MDLDERAVLFGYLPSAGQVELSRRLSRRELAAIVSAMSHDERADLFKKLDEKEEKGTAAGVGQAEREDVCKLASYPEGTVGSVMTSDYAALTPDLKVGKALSELRIQPPDSETIYIAYIVHEERRLVGVISLRDLLLARSGERISDLMTTSVVQVAADAPREEAAHVIAHYDLLALPVVNGGGKLIGIVTQDDAMDVQAEEATEDFHRSGTIQKLRESVRTASIFLLYRVRIVWWVLLVFFLPLLIGSGGNAGSQSSTLMVRALATGEVRFADWGVMIGREVIVATLLGLTMALAVSLLGFARSGVDVALVVAASMVLIVLVGMSLPFLLARFRLDPATASGPNRSPRKCPPCAEDRYSVSVALATAPRSPEDSQPYRSTARRCVLLVGGLPFQVEVAMARASGTSDAMLKPHGPEWPERLAGRPRCADGRPRDKLRDRPRPHRGPYTGAQRVVRFH